MNIVRGAESSVKKMADSLTQFESKVFDRISNRHFGIHGTFDSTKYGYLPKMAMASKGADEWFRG